MDTLTYERTTRTYDARHLLGIAVACGFIGGCGNSDHTARDRVIADFAATLTTAGPSALREPPGGRHGADGISAATGFVPSGRRVNLIDHHWSFRGDLISKGTLRSRPRSPSESYLARSPRTAVIASRSFSMAGIDPRASIGRRTQVPTGMDMKSTLFRQSRRTGSYRPERRPVGFG